MACYGRKSRKREMLGKSRTKAYSAWSGMVSRCLNSDNEAYANYGGRGIKLDPKWRLFSRFYQDMGDPPQGMSLDRIDNDKGYNKENCQWADRKQQSRNRRGRRIITAFGKAQMLCEWSEQSGIGHSTILRRLRCGWSSEDSVSLPTKHVRRGIPRGQKIKDQYGDRHGVVWSEPNPWEGA